MSMSEYLIAIELGACLGLSMFLTWFAVRGLRKVVSNVVEEKFCKHKPSIFNHTLNMVPTDRTDEVLHELRKIQKKAEIKTKWDIDSIVRIGEKYYRITRIIADQEKGNIETVLVEAVETFPTPDVRGDEE